MNFLKPLLLMSLFSLSVFSQKTDPIVPIYDINIKTINGDDLELSNFKNKKILIVNVASKCGFTKQYEGLQNLYSTYKGELMIIGVPCNQFGAQEPGTAKEIQDFCKINYGVDFIITEKIDVKGQGQHPLYKCLTSKDLNGNKNSSVKWNFQKYLIDEDGKLLDFFYSGTSPSNSKITKYLK